MLTYTLIPVYSIFFYKELEWQSKISRTVITRFVTTVITSFVTTVITSFVTTSTPRTDNFETYTLYI